MCARLDSVQKSGTERRRSTSEQFREDVSRRYHHTKMWIDVFGALRAAHAIDGCPRGLREVGHSSGLSGIDLCGSELLRGL